MIARASAATLLLLAGIAALSLRSPYAGADGKDGKDGKGEGPVLSAEQFTKEYAEDPAEFDKKYKGKVVTIEGVVNSVAVKVTSTGGAGPAKTYLMVAGYSKKGEPVPYSVRCEESGPDFEGVHTGHKVRIRGTAQGHSKTSYAAELRDCKVVKVFAPDYPPSDAVRAEVKKLQGTWKIVDGEESGKKYPAEQLPFTALGFEGYQALLHQGKNILSFGLAVADPAAAPRHIDLIGQRVMPCVYSLEGDRLKFVLPAQNKDGSFIRPTSLDTTQSRGLVLIAERQK